MSDKTSKPANASANTQPDKRPGDRIAKVIARAGLASRREAERLIEEGKVTVNGDVITRAALNVTEDDKVTVNGKEIGAPEPARLWLYHKPTGLVTTTRDEKGRATIYDDLPDALPRVMSVGRLDLNSEGLLLLTNDGEVKRKLELPSTGWLRKYRVRVNGRPSDATLEPLRKGITVDGEHFQPMTATLDSQKGANAWITIALREGKNREIRRAMDAVGLRVNRLIRVSYGPFQLGTLGAGEVEELRRRVVRDQLGMDIPGDPHNPSDKTAPAGRPGRSGRPGGARTNDGFGGPGQPGRPVEPTEKPAGKFAGKPKGKFGGKPGDKPFGKPGYKGGPKSGGNTNGGSGRPMSRPTVKRSRKP